MPEVGISSVRVTRFTAPPCREMTVYRSERAAPSHSLLPVSGSIFFSSIGKDLSNCLWSFNWNEFIRGFAIVEFYSTFIRIVSNTKTFRKPFIGFLYCLRRTVSNCNISHK